MSTVSARSLSSPERGTANPGSDGECRTSPAPVDNVIKPVASAALCQVCRYLVDDTLNDNIGSNSRWKRAEKSFHSIWRTAHRSHSDQLCLSSSSCSLCRILLVNIAHLVPTSYVISKQIYSRKFSVLMEGSITSELYDDVEPSFVFSEPYDLSSLLDLKTPLLHYSSYPTISDNYLIFPIKDLSWLGKRISPLPESVFCLALLKRWLSDCRTFHSQCAVQGLHKLPTRIINVGNSNSNAFLYVSKGETTPYLTLSHCWGGALKSKCVTTNISKYEAQISLEDMPVTFRDAITMTRSLGFQYIWIDAICILQDDHDDWIREAAKMGSYYGHSALTIAVGDASCSEDGFLKPRDPGAVDAAPLGVYSFPDKIERDLYIQKCNTDHWAGRHLDQRGWTLQERILSPRTIHYTDKGMFWECRELFSHEKGGSQLLSTIIKGLYLRSWADTEKVDGLPGLWRRLVGNYTSRKLTMPGDKLPAISGLAAMFQTLHDGEYLAGIWKHELPSGLLWKRSFRQDGPLVPSQSYRAPSWSWASLDGEIQWADLNDIQLVQDAARTKFRILEATNAETIKGSFSHVTSGSLLVTGILESAYYHFDWQGTGSGTNDEDLLVPGEKYGTGPLKSGFIDESLSGSCICWMDTESNGTQCWLLPCLVGEVTIQWGRQRDRKSDLGSERYRVSMLVLEEMTGKRPLPLSTTNVGTANRQECRRFKRVGVASWEVQSIAVMETRSTEMIIIE